MRVISVINQKGGCGKTTTAINLAACLARLKKRILLIDLDPQGHASLGLNLKPENITQGMTEVLTQEAELEEIVCGSPVPGLEIAPSDITLSAAEPLLANAPHKEQRLDSAIRTLTEPYDYVFIDCPPNLGLLTFNALRASSEAVVPIEISFFSLHGLAKLAETIELVERHTGHGVTLSALPTMVNARARFTQEVMAEIGRHFEGRVFKTFIRNNIRLREAASHGLPISEYNERTNGFLDYAALAEEVVAAERHPRVAAVSVRPEPAPEMVSPRPGPAEAEAVLGDIRADEVLKEQRPAPSTGTRG
ncbi:MAG TPA: ParA family protein [Nitrospiria bacterium]